MVEESKYYSDVMKHYFNKKLVMTKKDFVDFVNFIKCWICDYVWVDAAVKVIDHRHITVNNKVAAYRDCNMKVTWNHKIPVVFHNLKNYDDLFILQKLCKF